MQNLHMSVRVLVKDRPVTEFKHQNQLFIEGRPGSDFEIEITNLTNSRTLAVISVDGLSIMDGKPAGDESDGYLLNAHQKIRIPGWKLDNSQVAKFAFSSRKDSYAQQGGGNATNCGVIGIMLFAEKVKTVITTASYPPGYRGINSHHWDSHLKGMTGNIGGSAGGSLGNGGSYQGMSSTTMAGSWVPDGASQESVFAAAAASDSFNAVAQNASVNNLGTEFGAAHNFATVTVDFDKGTLLSTGALYYDDARGLKARGIVIERPSRAQYRTTPDPFPASSCKPPKGWTGR